MPFPSKDSFIDQVLSYIKFKHDHKSIRSELNNHIEDSKEFYLENGYDLETATKLSINNMGSPEIIGSELNKQHNPVIGYIWYVTKRLAILLTIFTIVSSGPFILMLLFNKNPLHEFPKSQILYQLDMNEKVKLDDRVLSFTDVIYDIHGNIHVFYKDYTMKLSLNYSPYRIYDGVTDNLGNTYTTLSGVQKNGFISKNQLTIHDFSSNADTLIITYDHFDRYYQIVIPLKEGDIFE